jgi:hyperosmotically inducible protein
MGRLQKLVTGFVTIFILTPAVARNVFPNVGPQATNPNIVREVRHELRMLPWYGVFDWLEFEVKPDSSVVLRGYVVRATTRSGAEAAVRRIEGVTGVTNEIVVLPPSPQDQRLRIAVYRALYNTNSPLFRYAIRSTPSIHIIVNRGRATLRGVVDRQADAQIAYMRTRGVRGLFEVRNELTVAGEPPE